VPTYYAAVHLKLCNPNPEAHRCFKHKMAHRLLLPWKMFTPILVFLRLFELELEACARQTDGQGDGRARLVMRHTMTAAWKRTIIAIAGKARDAAAYVIHDVGPALKRDALKDGQHGQAEVVEVGDAEVWTDPVEVADLVHLERTLETLAAWPCRLLGYFTYTHAITYFGVLCPLGQKHTKILVWITSSGVDRFW